MAVTTPQKLHPTWYKKHWVPSRDTQATARRTEVRGELHNMEVPTLQVRTRQRDPTTRCCLNRYTAQRAKGALQQHLQLQAGNIKTYALIRSLVVGYHREASSSNSYKHSHQVATTTSMVQQRQGKERQAQAPRNKNTRAKATAATGTTTATTIPISSGQNPGVHLGSLQGTRPVQGRHHPGYPAHSQLPCWRPRTCSTHHSTTHTALKQLNQTLCYKGTQLAQDISEACVGTQECINYMEKDYKGDITMQQQHGHKLLLRSMWPFRRTGAIRNAVATFRQSRMIGTAVHKWIASCALDVYNP